MESGEFCSSWAVGICLLTFRRFADPKGLLEIAGATVQNGIAGQFTMFMGLTNGNSLKTSLVCVVLSASLLLPEGVLAQFTPGARTLEDPYLPTLGNGGFDVLHYDLTINYDPVANTMVSIADVTIQATQNLSEFSLDLRGFPGATVTIDGVPAGALQVTNKLIITPAVGIELGREFHAIVNYSGRPAAIPFLDGTNEGWVRIGGGAFVVNEPRGSMGWFPNNNHPSDKATFDFHITVPSTHTALGNGELVSKVDHEDGTSTWNWHMGFPMATYLSTATVGRFDYAKTVSTNAVGASGNLLEIYDALESALPATQKTAAANVIVRQNEIIQFIADELGVPFPFDSHGIVLHRSSIGFIALEVQTKSHFAVVPIDPVVLAHEIAHQWYGDSISPATWREIWFNEGWATWWEWYWNNKQNGSPATVERQFTATFNLSGQPWNMPPADVPAAQMFSYFPVYLRPGMMIEAYRQIVGHGTFMAFQQALVTEHAYSTISEAQFIALAKRFAQERSGFVDSYLAQLDEFFTQWLHGRTKPTLTPTTFFRDLEPLLAVRRISPSQLEIVWSQPNAPFVLEQSESLTGGLWTAVSSSITVTDNQAKATIEPPVANRFYRLRKE